MKNQQEEKLIQDLGVRWGEKEEREKNQTQEGQDYWTPVSNEVGAGNQLKGGGDGKPQRDSEQRSSKTEAVIPGTQEK